MESGFTRRRMRNKEKSLVPEYIQLRASDLFISVFCYGDENLHLSDSMKLRRSFCFSQDKPQLQFY